MRMNELHLKVLEMMERIRAKHKAMYYGTRRSNATRGEDRIGQGFVFLGNEQYIFVPICPMSAFPNPTTTVGLVFGLESGDFIESWVELDIPVVGGKNCHASHEDNAVYEKLAKFLSKDGAELKLEPTKHYVRKKLYVVKDGERCGDVVATFEKFIDKDIDQIVKVLGERKAGGALPLVYSQATMKRSIDRFLRHETQNVETRRRLTELRTSVMGVCK